MIDATLAALKRSAKAILRDELKAMRAKTRAVQKELAELREQNIANLSAMRLVQIDLARVIHQRDTTANLLARQKERATRAVRWARENGFVYGREHRAWQCLAEWTTSELGGPGFGIVNPFDRWDIPKP